MGISREREKSAFWRRIRYDPYILQKMELTGADDATIAKRIIKRRIVDEKLDETSRYICIYNAPSRRGENGAFLESLMQVDVFVPAAVCNVADDIMEQIVALLTHPRFTINGDTPAVDADAGDLAPPSGFYSTGFRFLYYPSKETQIKIV